MKKYTIIGELNVYAYTIVEANTFKEALEIALTRHASVTSGGQNEKEWVLEGPAQEPNFTLDDITDGHGCTSEEFHTAVDELENAKSICIPGTMVENKRLKST